MIQLRVFFTVISVIVLSSNCANARPWYVEPGVSLSAGYDDNPNLSTDTDAEITEDPGQLELIENQGFALVGGDIRLGSDTGSDLIAFDLAAIARRYDDSELDSEYMRAAALYQKSGIKHDFGVEAGLSRDSTLETELEDTGILEFNVDRDQAFIGSALTTRFSQSLIGEFELNYRDISFSSGMGEFTDFEDIGGSAQLERIVSERLGVFGLVEFLRYQPTGFIELGEVERDDFASAQVGINYNLTEQLALSLSVGRGFTDTDQFGNAETGEVGTIRFSDNSSIYSVGLGYTGERSTIDTVYSSSFDSSADGGLSKIERFGIGLTRPETLGGTFNFQATYITRDPVRGETDSRDYYALTPRIVWQINQNFSVSAEIEYREQELTDTITNLSEQADSTSATVGLRYDFGRKRVSY